MHIGLIGGIGPAATDLYYRGLVGAMKALDTDLEMTIVHADAPTLVRNFEAKQAAAQAAIYLRLTERLVAAGAETVAITSIGGHFCIEEFRPLSPLPIIDFIAEMDSFLEKQTFSKVGLLGTDTVMETKFYGGIRSTDVLIPPPDVIGDVHRAYVGMALGAKVTDEQRAVVFEAGRALSERGAETVLLGGTDLFLAFDGHDPGFATLDCATVHIEAIARMASK